MFKELTRSEVAFFSFFFSKDLPMHAMMLTALLFCLRICRIYVAQWMRVYKTVRGRPQLIYKYSVHRFVRFYVMSRLLESPYNWESNCLGNLPRLDVSSFVIISFLFTMSRKRDNFFFTCKGLM